MAKDNKVNKKDEYGSQSESGIAQSQTGSGNGPLPPITDVEKIYNDLRQSMHGNVDGKQWKLPPESKREECIAPPVIE